MTTGTPNGGSSDKDRGTVIAETSVVGTVNIVVVDNKVSALMVVVIRLKDVEGVRDVDDDGSLLLVVVVAVVTVVVTRTVEEVVVVKGSVVVLAILVVVGLGMVVGDDVLDERKVVVVSDGGTPVVDTDIVVVGQC